MKLSSDLPLWVAVPLRVILYLVVMFVLYNIAAVFVVGRLASNVLECSASKNARGVEALAYARQMVVCLDHKNSFLENFAFRRIRAAIDAMPNHPKELVGRWSSAQPRCQYEFELRETGEFVAEPRACSISDRTFVGQWGVHDGQMVWLYAGNGPWRPDINPMDVVDRDFFLLTELDGSRTRFTRIGPLAASVATREGEVTQPALLEQTAEGHAQAAPPLEEAGKELAVSSTGVAAGNAPLDIEETPASTSPEDRGPRAPDREPGAHGSEDK